jgi:hypothetical protein
MKKIKVINYKNCVIDYSVFGQDGRYSAVAKIALSAKATKFRKFITLNNNCSSEKSAEEQIIQEARRTINNLSE